MMTFHFTPVSSSQNTYFDPIRIETSILEQLRLSAEPALLLTPPSALSLGDYSIREGESQDERLDHTKHKLHMQTVYSDRYYS